MADLLVSAVVSAVVKKVTESLVQRIGEMWGINGQRERLHNMLLEIQAVLPDAEQRANSNTAVKSWLEKLKSAAYDADDLLDNFCYQELHRDAIRHGQKVSNISSFLSLQNPSLFQYKLSGKLKKLIGRIDGLLVQMERFRFGQGQHVQVVNRARTDSLVVQSKVVGREKDKEEIIKLLLETSDNSDLRVVPVVGMGGVGKTTLAQLVYNDPRVKEHFELALWICVSEEFNIGIVVKSIIELVVGDCNVPINNMELLQRRLRKVLEEKRYILFLDDVWNENVNEWEHLRALLKYGDSRSAVIVTTRSRRVAFIMGTMRSYNLGCLSEDDSWNLFHRRAFSMGVEESRELVKIGKKMVENCRGLPLAINALGSLMSCKYEVQEWLAIYEESRIWETRLVQNEVLPVLRLSYDHLPSYMKQCFAFCAVFPKDYELDKEKLIQYWMANGFIPFDGPGSLEMKGNDIFNELAWRSFFHDVKQFRSVHRIETKCKMHDLMHDLAQSIMGDECLSTLEIPAQISHPIITIRHISTKRIPLDINKTMNNFPSIRSLISISTNGSGYACNIGFQKSISLRILEFKVYNRLLEKTMITPEKMKYLRYLELQCSETLLPEAICTLYLLQTLRLTRCRQLIKLPEGMRFMSILRHLYIEDCSNLISMPPGHGLLNCLQILTTYIIGIGPGNSIAELKNLNLHGTLHLYNIRKVRDVNNAREANLIAKLNLDNLALCWGILDANQSAEFKVAKSNDLEVMYCDPHEVLDALKPCNNLKVLQVAQYMGDEFPVWMMEYSMLENLIELYIIDCRKCTKMLPVDKLPFLQILNLQFLNNLRHLCHSGCTIGQSAKDISIAFPSLESMVLYEMPNLSSWYEGEFENETSLVFPVLKRLEIINCHKLTAMPIVPFLENLSVKGNILLSCFATRLTTLKGLSLESYDGDNENENESLFFQPSEFLNNLSLTGYNSIIPIGAKTGEEGSVPLTKCRVLNLISSKIFLSLDIVSNSSLWFWKCFTFLEELVIRYCDNLIYWPEDELRSMNCLRRIDVGFCPNFLGSPSGRSITGALLPNLEIMWIHHCPNLVKIPKCSTSIRELCIHCCLNLRSLPEWLGSMVALKKFKIIGCENLHFLPLSMGGLTSLKKLVISRCPNIRALPEGLLQQLKNLDELWIEGCPHLGREFKKDGKYRHMTSEIRFTKIRGDLLY
ncbi:NBS-LRR-like resistance protein [Rhynchospora pubera]|uniref:NBS-LRR-like resistance protein n=1 Tax=Rhynchospora pubera TaxID=906938 RepID=A0AAV8EP10_9POAL|nr:NBS-LRR-like resistance protein [Rhynchospora pubera]